MASIRPLVLLPPLIFLALAALFLAGMRREDPEALPTALAGQAAPPAPVEPLGDLRPFDAAALDAPGVKLVNFWASWCAPCRVEHPHLDALAAEGIPIYGVNFKDDPAKALAFLDELGNPYAAAGADPQGRIALDWGVYGVPETFVIDGDGRIVFRFAGPVTGRAINRDLRPALAGAAAASR